MFLTHIFLVYFDDVKLVGYSSQRTRLTILPDASHPQNGFLPDPNNGDSDMVLNSENLNMF